MLPGLRENGAVVELDAPLDAVAPSAAIKGAKESLLRTARTQVYRESLGCNLTEPMRWKQIVAMLGQVVPGHGVVVDINVSKAGSVLADGPKPPGLLPVGHPIRLIFQKERFIQ